jgi:hypothetical protein
MLYDIRKYNTSIGEYWRPNRGKTSELHPTELL